MIAVFALLSSITFIKARSYSGPIAFYNSSISLNLGNALLYTNRGAVKVNMGDIKDAISDFTKAIILTPEDYGPYSNRGIAYSALGDLDKAIKDFDKALELNPNYANAYNNRGNAYQTIRDFVKAIKGPCPWTSIMPTGGVEPTLDNLRDWFNAGVTCVGIGSNLITKELIQKKSWDTLTKRIAAAVKIARMFKLE